MPFIVDVHAEYEDNVVADKTYDDLEAEDVGQALDEAHQRFVSEEVDASWSGPSRLTIDVRSA